MTGVIACVEVGVVPCKVLYSASLFCAGTGSEVCLHCTQRMYPGTFFFSLSGVTQQQPQWDYSVLCYRSVHRKPAGSLQAFCDVGTSARSWPRSLGAHHIPSHRLPAPKHLFLPKTPPSRLLFAFPFPIPCTDQVEPVHFIVL